MEGEEGEIIISKRLQLMESVWEKTRQILAAPNDRVVLSLPIAVEVVGSYYRHIERYKRDQNIPRADKHKIAGFMIHWICRLKPIQIIAPEPGEDPVKEKHALANELFAIHFSASILDCPTDFKGHYNYFFAFVQRLRERECPAEFLALQLYLFEQHCKASCKLNSLRTSISDTP